MKNALLIGGLFLGSVVAAVVVWAAVGGSGGERRAALVEPTQAGSIGELTIGGVRGGEAMPVRSFNWHRVRSDSYHRIEVLRDGGEGSPALFNFGTGGLTAGVTLDLVAPRGTGPYLRYQLTNARLDVYRSGTLEKLVLRDTYVGEVTDGRSAAPEPDPSDIVGYMILGEDRVPILAFNSGLRDEYWYEAVIRRPLDQLAATLNEAVDGTALLGIVTIELQAPGEEAPRITYELSGQMRVQFLTDSVAAGVSPTEEVTLNFRRMRVTHGQSSACYDAQTQGNC